MKTLYESILDDEDILIDNIKKTSNNPFELIYELFKGDFDIKDIQLILDEGVLDDFIEKKLFLNPKEIDVFVSGDRVTKRIELESKQQYDPILKILYRVEWPEQLTLVLVTKTKLEELFTTNYINGKSVLTFPWVDTDFYKKYNTVCNNIKKEGFEKKNGMRPVNKTYKYFSKKMR